MSPADAPPLLVGLPPLTDDRSRVLVLGSFPSEESLRRQQYYAFSRNQFWPIIGELFGIDTHRPYAERSGTLLDNHVGVWDVISSCIRKGSADQAIREDQPSDLLGLVERHPGIEYIAFNGGKAWDTATKDVPQLFMLPRIQCHRMPSTSPAHAGMSFAEKVERWSILKHWLEA